MRIYLKDWRKTRAMTQEELALALGTSKGTISRLEREIYDWDRGWVVRLAEALSLKDEGDLFRHPSKSRLQSLLDAASPEQREKAEELLETFLRPRESEKQANAR